MLENLEKSTAIATQSRAARSNKAGKRVRPLLSGQPITLLAFVVCDLEYTTNDGQKKVLTGQEGFILLDGRFLSIDRLFGARTTDETGARYAPFEVINDLPAQMREAIAGCNLGTSGAQVRQMMANFGINGWDATDWDNPIPLRAKIGAQRTGGTTGLSRWYWLEDVEAVTLPENGVTDPKKVFMERFGDTLTNAAMLWSAIAQDEAVASLWAKVLALSL